MSEIQANKLSPASGTGVQLGDSGDTITIPSGATITNNGTQTGFGGANTPSFHAYRNSAQTLSNNTYQRVQFDTEVWDTANGYDNTTNYRYTPNEAGKYVFYAKISIYTGTNDNVKFQTILFQKNGSDASVHSLDSRNGYYMGYGNGMYFQQVLDMNGTSDYVDTFFYLQANNTSDLRVNGGHQTTYFGAYKLIGV